MFVLRTLALQTPAGTDRQPRAYFEFDPTATVVPLDGMRLARSMSRGMVRENEGVEQGDLLYGLGQHDARVEVDRGLRPR